MEHSYRTFVRSAVSTKPGEVQSGPSNITLEWAAGSVLLAGGLGFVLFMWVIAMVTFLDEK
jgi:hypothetical protein